jgi:hypothetical protein
LRNYNSSDNADFDWSVEVIPGEAVLFMRAHQSYFKAGQLQPGVFTVKTENNQPPTPDDGLSMNWQKYCPTAAEARRKAKIPARNAVVSFIAERIRTAQLQPAITVVHSPVLDGPHRDRSHSLVKGFVESTSNRAQLMQIVHREIEFDEPVS